MKRTYHATIDITWDVDVDNYEDLDECEEAATDALHDILDSTYGPVQDYSIYDVEAQ